MASFQGRQPGGSRENGPYGARIEKSSVSMLEGSFPNPELKLKAERLDFLASQEVFLQMFARREQALARWRKIKTVVKGSSLLRAVDSKDFIAVFEGKQQPRPEEKHYVIMPSSWVKFIIYLAKIALLFYNFFYLQIVYLFWSHPGSLSQKTYGISTCITCRVCCAICSTFSTYYATGTFMPSTTRTEYW